MSELFVDNLTARTVRGEGKVILKNLSLKIRGGEIHALMGPNGAGKSTLGYVLMGHPDYEIVSGRIMLDGKDISNLPPEERARRGLFLAYQQPVELQGVKISSFLRAAYNQMHPDEKMGVTDFYKMVRSYLKRVGLDESFLSRSVNDGFSGGEKKRLEILQMVVLRPKFVILDEIDSGLDVDALKLISEEIRAYHSESVAFLIITHYQRILKDIEPEFVHVLLNGTIAINGGVDVANSIEKEGYEWVRGVTVGS